MEIYQLVVCFPVCVHTGEAFINQPGRCALQSRLCDTEDGGGVGAEGELESEGRRHGATQKSTPTEKALQDEGTGERTLKRDCSKEDLAAVTQLPSSEKKQEREEERGFLYNRPILTL